MSKFQNDAIFWVDVDKIDPNPYQPRRDFNEEGLRDLAESIRQYGVLQPLTVTRNEETKPDGGLKVYYELIAGERRLRAAKMANLSQVPVTIRDEKEDAEVKLELAIIENLQREDLNPIERAEAFNQLSEEFDFTHKEIAGKIGKSREYVSNSMRLLKLPEKIKQAVIAGKITEGHARPIMMLRDKPDKQQQLFKEVVRKELTVRETEQRARRDAQDKVRKKKNKVDPETKALEDELSDTLGTRVTIEKDKEGGKLVIDFFSDDDLESLIEMVKNSDEDSVDAVMEEYANALNQNAETADSEDNSGSSEDENENTDTQADKTEGFEDRSDNNDTDANTADEADQIDPDADLTELEGKGMAETLGTMIQQAREKREQEEQAKQPDASADSNTKKVDNDEADANTDSEGDAQPSKITAKKKPEDTDTNRVKNAPIGGSDNTFSDISEHDTEATSDDKGQQIAIDKEPQKDHFETGKKANTAKSADAKQETHATTENTSTPQTHAGKPVEEPPQDNQNKSENEKGSDKKSDKDSDALNQANASQATTSETESTPAKKKSPVSSDASDEKTEEQNNNKETEPDKKAKSKDSDQKEDEDDMYAVSNFSI